MSRRKLRINEIPEEIDSSSGNAVVCLREIIIPGVKGPSKNFYYLETGIIDGNFETMSEVGVVREVYVPPRGEGDAYRYIYSLDSGIPVIRKLAMKSFSRPSLNYKSSVDEESNWEEEGVGIAFGRYEFGGYNLFPVSNHFTKARKAGQILDLEKISIFIGDSSIQQALLSYDVPELEINSFLDMISSTGGLEDELSSFGIDNKERVVQGLVERVANLCVVYSQIRNVKDIVLDSEYVCKNGLKGRWWEWNNPSEVHAYLDLKSQADKLVSEVKSLMNDSREVGFENIPFINGECIGFPSKVETRAYFRFVTENILFPLKEDLFELNKHINQNKNRVNQS